MSQKGSRPKTWSVEQDELLVELHAQGRRLVDVAEELGKSATAVSRRAKQLGLKWSGSAQMNAAIASHQERAAERRAKVDALLAYSNAQVAVHLARLANALEEEEGFFYVRGKGGEMVKKRRGPEDPLPIEHVEAVVKMVNDTFLTGAKVQSLSKTDDVISEGMSSLMKSLGLELGALEFEESVLEENREVEPGE